MGAGAHAHIPDQRDDARTQVMMAHFRSHQKTTMTRFAFCLAALLLPLSSLAQRNVDAGHACFAKPSHADARGCLRDLDDTAASLR